MKALLVLVLWCAVAEARGHSCHGGSRVVGRQRCSQFGSGWAHDPWLGFIGFEPALAFESVEVHGVDTSGTVFSATQSAGYHIALAPGTRHRLDALGPRLRTAYRGPNVTFAFDLTSGFAFAGPRTITSVEGFAPAATSGGTVFDLAGVIGYHGRRGALQLGGELAIGLREIVLDAATPPGFTACQGGATGRRCYVAGDEEQLLVEPRARVEWWLTPEVSVALTGGVDLATRGESLSASITAHMAAFDGS